MSLERTDQYVKELEEIKNYEKVKAENASLLARVRELELRLSCITGKVEELLQVIKNLEGQVRARDEEIESLRCSRTLPSGMRGNEAMNHISPYKPIKSRTSYRCRTA